MRIFNSSVHIHARIVYVVLRRLHKVYDSQNAVLYQTWSLILLTKYQCTIFWVWKMCFPLFKELYWVHLICIVSNILLFYYLKINKREIVFKHWYESIWGANEEVIPEVNTVVKLGKREQEGNIYIMTTFWSYLFKFWNLCYNVTCIPKPIANTIQLYLIF